MLVGGVAIGASAIAFGFISKAVSTFDENLRRAAALGGLTTAQMWDLAEAINVQAVRWGVSADSISEGVLELTKAGVTGMELTDVLETATMAVRGFGLTWQDAATIYITSTRAFASEGLTVQEVFDKIGAAATATRIDFADFVDVFKFVAGTANLVGVSFEQVVGMAATLSQVGTNAGIGARGVQTMILALIQNQAEFQRWLNTMGIGVELIKDGNLNLLGLIEAFKGVDPEIVENADALAFLGRQGIRAFAGLIQGAQQYTDLLGVMSDSQGTTRRIAELMLGSMSALWTQLVETILAPLRTESFITRLQDILELLGRQMTDIAPRLADFLFRLVSML